MNCHCVSGHKHYSIKTDWIYKQNNLKARQAEARKKYKNIYQPGPWYRSDGTVYDKILKSHNIPCVLEAHDEKQQILLPSSNGTCQSINGSSTLDTIFWELYNKENNDVTRKNILNKESVLMFFIQGNPKFKYTSSGDIKTIDSNTIMQKLYARYKDTEDEILYISYVVD
ncbi:MAG: hypothetical protein II393_04570 [Cytophagales bacterium]|nr:hypothetical protein [Cytophagales bacterium]